jgi:hypothetical protein
MQAIMQVDIHSHAVTKYFGYGQVTKCKHNKQHPSLCQWYEQE